MCAFLTYFHFLAANHQLNISLKSKKSGKHVAAGTSEAFRKFLYFFQNFGSAPQSRTRREVHFGQGQHVCPGESRKSERNCIVMYDKYRMVYYNGNFGRGRSGGGGGEMGGRTRRARLRGHVHLPKTVEIRQPPVNSTT